MLQCLGKLVIDEVTFQYNTEQGFIIQGLNANCSTYCKFDLKNGFFDLLESVEDENIKIGTALKPLISVFRSVSTIENVEFIIETSENLRVVLHSQHGISKMYSLKYAPSDPRDAVCNKEGAPVHLTVTPDVLDNALANFHSSIREITFLLEENSESLHIGSYVDDVQNVDAKKSTLTTSVQVGLKYFVATNPTNYVKHDKERLDTTFSVKDLKVFTQFCRQIPANLTMFLVPAPNPFILEVLENEYSCLLILATMTNEEAAKSQQTQTAQQQQQQKQQQQPASGAAVSSAHNKPSSNKTNISDYEGTQQPQSGSPSRKRKRGEETELSAKRATNNTSIRSTTSSDNVPRSPASDVHQLGSAPQVSPMPDIHHPLQQAPSVTSPDRHGMDMLDDDQIVRESPSPPHDDEDEQLLPPPKKKARLSDLQSQKKWHKNCAHAPRNCRGI